MLPPFLADITDKTDTDSWCPSSGQPELGCNHGCKSFRRKGRSEQQLRPSSPADVEAAGVMLSEEKHRGCLITPQTEHADRPSWSSDSGSLDKNEFSTILLWNQNLNLCPPQITFFSLITENKTF